MAVLGNALPNGSAGAENGNLALIVAEIGMLAYAFPQGDQKVRTVLGFPLPNG
jgi:hypothetical protein